MFATASSHELCCFTSFVMGSAETAQSQDVSFMGTLAVLQYTVRTYAWVFHNATWCWGSFSSDCKDLVLCFCLLFMTILWHLQKHFNVRFYLSFVLCFPNVNSHFKSLFHLLSRPPCTAMCILLGWPDPQIKILWVLRYTVFQSEARIEKEVWRHQEKSVNVLLRFVVFLRC